MGFQLLYRILLLGLLVCIPAAAIASQPRPRVAVLSDIGGTDPDDFQSMVHLLVYADMFELEGLISSPYGPGRREHILEVISAYEKDFANLRSYSGKYPTPSFLRKIAKQGALESPGPAGVGSPTEGSQWLVKIGRKPDPRPLFVLVWGGIEDLAQALHDAPDILPKLRVYWIGGPNKMWSADAYDYIEQHHPKLWMIESNSTYRGWFTGGNQVGEWSNQGFVSSHIKGKGALGDYFASKLGGVLKMGDSPSVAWLLNNDTSNPASPGWGGQYRRVWDGRKKVVEGPPSESEVVETFGIFEIVLKVPDGFDAWDSTSMVFDSRVKVRGAREGQRMRFRFSPRDSKVWNYTIQSSFKGFDDVHGTFRAVPASGILLKPSTRHPNWWTDDPGLEFAEGQHPGAKTVSKWRVDYLSDFAARLRRCEVRKTN